MEALEAEQREVAGAVCTAEPWTPPPAAPLRVAGVFVAHLRGGGGPGRAGEPAWVAGVLLEGGRTVATAAFRGQAGAAYVPGLLALRDGALLERGVRALGTAPGVVLVDATGRDHPRGAGLALHLGARLGLPTVGVTDRTLVATGDDPGPGPGSATPLLLDGEVVGYRVRTRAGTRPVAVHAAWRTSPEVARDVVLETVRHARTPEPLRAARRAARTLRAQDAI